MKAKNLKNCKAMNEFKNIHSFRSKAFNKS